MMLMPWENIIRNTEQISDTIKNTEETTGSLKNSMMLFLLIFGMDQKRVGLSLAVIGRNDENHGFQIKMSVFTEGRKSKKAIVRSEKDITPFDQKKKFFLKEKPMFPMGFKTMEPGFLLRQQKLFPWKTFNNKNTKMGICFLLRLAKIWFLLGNVKSTKFYPSSQMGWLSYAGTKVFQLQMSHEPVLWLVDGYRLYRKEKSRDIHFIILKKENSKSTFRLTLRQSLRERGILLTIWMKLTNFQKGEIYDTLYINYHILCPCRIYHF